MKKMYMMLCMFGLMAGCGKEPPAIPLTAEQIKAYQDKQAITIHMDGYQSTLLERYCLDGVEYYTARSGHAMLLTPVVDKTTLLFKPCGLP